MVLCEQPFQMNAVLFHYGLTPIHGLQLPEILLRQSGRLHGEHSYRSGAVQLLPLQREACAP